MPTLRHRKRRIQGDTQSSRTTQENRKRNWGFLMIAIGTIAMYIPSTKCLPKNPSIPLRCRGLTAFHILGRLPDVYQFYFFTWKGASLTDFLLSFATFHPRARGVTQACFWQKVKKSQNIWSKRRTLLRKCWRSTVYHNWNGVLVLIKSRPLSGRKIL